MKLTYRSAGLISQANDGPSTLDEDTRSVEVVGATENPVSVFDWERGVILDEVLLMSGIQMPESRQIPLLDTHTRIDTSSVIGSFRDIKIHTGQLTGRAFFSGAAEALSPFQKVREGHLTDFSIGYKVIDSVYIPDGQRQEIEGRSFTGPLKVTTKWLPKELSVCPIGADEQAKVRAADIESDKYANAKNKEDKGMDEKIRAFLESRGLNKDATETEAYRFLEGLDIKTDIEKEKSEAIRTERERITEIRSWCAFAKQDDMAEDLIQKGLSVEQARKELYDKTMKTVSAATPGFRPAAAEVVETARERFRSAAIDSLALRAGIKLEDKPAPGAEELRGFSLRELAREALKVANQDRGGSVMEMVGRALTTSDFPIILANIANKSLFEGYETAPETWRTWCGTGSVNDFKTHTMVRASETGNLDEIPEHGEYKYDTRSEAKEEYKIVTYGKLFAIGRQTIINDDLSALTDIPRQHGEAAARKIGDLPYAVLTANAAMGDGVALFASPHGNIGTGGAPSETTMNNGIMLMKLQKDIGGLRRLNINPLFFIAPVALEGAAEIFFNSTQFAGANLAATRTNPYAGTRFTRIYEPRLDDASSVVWYLAGAKGKTVVVFFLGGNETPYLETKQGWTVDGVEYKVRIDAGAKAVDWKALLRNPGS